MAQEAQPSRKAPVDAPHLAYTHTELMDHVRDAEVKHSTMSHAGKDLSSAGSYPYPGGMVEADTPPSSSRSGSGDLPTHDPFTLEVGVLCRVLVLLLVPVAWLLVGSVGLDCFLPHSHSHPSTPALVPTHSHRQQPQQPTSPLPPKKAAGKKRQNAFAAAMSKAMVLMFNPSRPESSRGGSGATLFQL